VSARGDDPAFHFVCKVGDQLASELAAASMPTLLAEIEAVLNGEDPT
jgi:hypothetical protein